MKNIFVGFLFERQREAELLKICGNVSSAANQYQMGFITGLQKKLEILSCLIVPTFGRKCRKFFFPQESGIFDRNEILYLPFHNFYFLRDFDFRRNLIKAIKNSVDQTDEPVTIYVYSLFIPSLKAIKKIKKEYGNRVHICLIIPDLPGKYGVMRKWYSPGGMRDRAEFKTKMDLPRYADSYVFLTDEMKALFPEKPSVVIEGFLPDDAFDHTAERQPKTVLYTGTFAAQFGVGNLLEAFSNIKDPDYRLWLCGAGGIQKAVEEYAAKDPRITYFGYLPKDEICELQSKCDVLINPRRPEGEYTKYSFPSKTMEYLLSGSKVLMYRLPGVGEEYYQYIYPIEDGGIDALKKSIEVACADTGFYEHKSVEQVSWIRQSKQAAAQVKKVKEMLGEQI